MPNRDLRRRCVVGGNERWVCMVEIVDCDGTVSALLLDDGDGGVVGLGLEDKGDPVAVDVIVHWCSCSWCRCGGEFVASEGAFGSAIG